MTFSPIQSCDALVTDGPPYWGAWRDIGVGSGLALIPLVTGPLPSPQKVNLKRCAAPPFISLGPFHFFSDVGLFVLTVTLGTDPQETPPGRNQRKKTETKKACDKLAAHFAFNHEQEKTKPSPM